MTPPATDLQSAPLDPENAHPDPARRVRESFERQAAMSLIGARLERVEPGLVEIALPWRPEIGQQHGYAHAGIIGTALDSACGYAALTRMSADAAVLTVEYKLNLLAPAAGAEFRMIGQVRKAGRTITVAEGEAWAVGPDGRRRLIATMTGTLMAVRDRFGVSD